MAGPPSRSSFPSVPGEPRIRRLGVGSSGGADRPLRAQVIVALVCVAMLIAVPLYLLRRPSIKATPAQAASSASSSAGPQAVPAPAAAASAAPPARLTLGAVQKVRCGSSPSASQNEGTLCDTLGPFEEALKKAVLTSEDCAPKAKVKGSINYVLTVDFVKKKTHVFPGASGEWHGKVARRATTCVANAIKITDWNVSHQYRHYAIAVMATYAAPAGTDVVVPPAAPSGTPAIPGAAPPPPGPTLPTFE